MIKTCQHCGKEFETIYALKKFCCSKCQQAAYRLTHLKALEKKICPTCGVEFLQTYACQKYCSKKCLYASKFKKKSDTSKSPRLQKECFNCGKDFVKSFPNERFCSDECRIQYFQSTGTKLSIWQGDNKIRAIEDLRRI